VWIGVFKLLDKANLGQSSSLGGCLTTLIFPRLVAQRSVRWLVTAALTVLVVVFMTIAVVNVSVDQQQVNCGASERLSTPLDDDAVAPALESNIPSANLPRAPCPLCHNKHNNHYQPSVGRAGHPGRVSKPRP